MNYRAMLGTFVTSVFISASASAIMPVQTHGIQYHQGVVLSGTLNIYVIFYGSPAADTQMYVEDFVDNIDWVVGDEQPWNIVTTYYDSSGARASNNLVFAGYTIDAAYSSGQTNADLDSIVQNAISSGLPSPLPADPNALYVVFADSSVTGAVGQSTLCSQACGFHQPNFTDSATINEVFVANCGICAYPYSAILHEMAESVTDPFFDGWNVTLSGGDEMADLCETNISDYVDVTVGRGESFPLQPLWVNKGPGYCASHIRQPGDLNNDGAADIALVGGHSSRLPVAWSDGSSAGGWTATNEFNDPIFLGLAAYYRPQVVSGDFDGDGMGDIALTGLPFDVIPALISTSIPGIYPGKGTFNLSFGIPGADFSETAALPGATAVAGDFDGDGRGDIAIVGGVSTERGGHLRESAIDVAFSKGCTGNNQCTNSLIAFDTTAIASLDALAFQELASEPGVKTVGGDFNGDSLDDIALVGGAGWTTIPIAFSNGDGSFSFQSPAPQPDNPSFTVWAAEADVTPVPGDFDGDGRADIALVGGIGWTTIPLVVSNFDGTNVSFTVLNVSNLAPTEGNVATFESETNDSGPYPTMPFRVGGRFNGYSTSGIALVGGWGGPANFATPWTTIPLARAGSGCCGDPPVLSWDILNQAAGAFPTLATVANAVPVGAY